MSASLRRTAVLVPVAFALLAATDPATCRLIRGQATEDPADDVSVCRTDVWIHHNGQRLANLAALGVGGYPTWDDTKPTASYQSGAGAVTVVHWGPDLAQQNNPAASYVVEGKVTGNLDNLAATLYLSAPGDDLVYGSNYYPHFQLSIDGQVVYQAGNSNEFTIPMTPVVDGISSIKFALTDMYDVIALANDPTMEHTVRLLVGGWAQGDEGAFYFDAAEVPAGIVFNIEKLAGYTEFPAG